MRAYSKRAFLIIKIPFVFLLLTVIFNLGKTRGADETREQVLRAYPVITYQEQGRPYCWNVEIFPVRAFDLTKMTMKVKRENPKQ